MPIYEYRCSSCGSENEHLQKLSDASIAVCPACGSDSYIKLISAAGFQLKGSGWYATDFKNSVKPKSDKVTAASGESTSAPTAASTPAPDATTTVTKETSPVSANQ
ncbi:MAG: zinc ribbon domain-containing protein [Nitrosomonadaceae bacterium]